MSVEKSPKVISKGLKKKKKLIINASSCKYDIVRECASCLGFQCSDDPKKWILFWIDTGVSLERILEMNAYQKINHFPGMSEICRKNLLAKNLSRIRIHKRKEFDFFPKSWILPSEWSDFNLNYRSSDHNVFIVKPDQGCQGKGIFLAKSPKQIIKIQKNNGSLNSDVVIQKYILRPFLIDGFKFDLRIYVLVTCMEPLRIFVYNEGLARFATEPYSEPKSKNFSSLFMHLTNYAINKNSEKFDKTEGGSKRSMSSVFKFLESTGVDVKELWIKICNALVKTVLIVQPQITKIMSVCFPKNRMEGFKTSFGSQCFEILGFDVLLDSKLKPWILEVNHSPSFSTDSDLDLNIKTGLIKETLVLVNLNSSMQKRFEKDQKVLSRSRLFGSLQTSKESVTSSTSSTSSKTLDSNNMVDSLETLKNIHCGTLSKKYKIYEDEHLGNFSRIFPPENEELLDSFLNLLLYLHSLPNTKNSETITTKARKEYLMTKQSTQDLKLLKYQDWKKHRLKIASKDSILNSKSQSFSLDSILVSKRTKPLIKSKSIGTEKCKIGLRIQNITYPSGARDNELMSLRTLYR